MNIKRKAFILGLFFLFFALLSVTVLPFAVLKYTHLDITEYSYIELEALFLICCAFLYVFSSKYYKYQIISILGALALYFFYLRIYDFVLK